MREPNEHMSRVQDRRRTAEARESRVTRRRALRAFGAAFGVLGAVACGDQAQPAEPTPAIRPSPTNVPPTPRSVDERTISATTTPRPTSSPTATVPAVAARATVAAPRPTLPVSAAPTPTATPLPSPTPTSPPSPTPSPTATPPPLVSPLTGLPISAASHAARIVAVKIDNAPGARPHSGLSQAGVVYEHVTEGSVTRYTAFFHDSGLERVGPIRSARFVDRDLVQQFDALFAHVGGSPPVLDDLRASPVADMDQFFYDETQPYFRSSDRAPPFNMYASLPALRDFGARRHPERRPLEGFAFYVAEPDSGQVRSVQVAGGHALFRSDYAYDPATRTWRRLLAGSLDVDVATGEALALANVIVQRVPTRLTEYQEDSLGNRSLWIGTTGSGTATVFRDGLRIEGRWLRDSATDVTRFETLDGAALLLRPGHSWVHLLSEADAFSSA